MAYTLLCWGGGLLCFPVWTASVSVGLSRHQWTRRQTGARAAGPAPPLCGVPTPPPYKQAVQWLCSVPSSGCTEAPGSLRGGSVCCPAGCNNGGWLLACRDRRRRRSSACTEWSGSVSDSQPALGPHTCFGCLWSRTASGWRWCDIFQSSLCGHGETWSAAEQQRRRLDSHRQRSGGWGCVQAGVTRAAGCTPEENRTAAFTLTQPKVQLGRPTSRLRESLKHTASVHFLIHTVIPRGNQWRCRNPACVRAEGADFSPQQTCQIRQSAQQSEVSVSTHTDTASANKSDPKWKRAETGRLTSARRSESYLMSAVLK